MEQVRRYLDDIGWDKQGNQKEMQLDGSSRIVNPCTFTLAQRILSQQLDTCVTT